MTLASNGSSLAFWKREFPDLPHRELPDYAISYAPGPFLLPKLLCSLPRLFRVRAAEHRLVGSWEGEFDVVVSDNRFGCCFAEKPSYFLTHQLHLAAPQRLAWGEGLGEKAMARLLAPFTEVWIPDREGLGLSGKLGHPRRPETFPPLRWIGPLSRFESPPAAESPWSGPWDVLVLVSGPEPARTGFKDNLRHLLGGLPGRHLVVQGLPHLPTPGLPDATPGVHAAPHLPTPDLAAALRGAARIVTRGGYSTLMDLDALGILDKRCLLIPTPGQTEQEYLARHLEATRRVPWASQSRLLHDGIRLAAG